MFIRICVYDVYVYITYVMTHLYTYYDVSMIHIRVDMVCPYGATYERPSGHRVLAWIARLSQCGRSVTTVVTMFVRGRQLVVTARRGEGGGQQPVIARFLM
jgi:hypothetical protein